MIRKYIVKLQMVISKHYETIKDDRKSGLSGERAHGDQIERRYCNESVTRKGGFVTNHSVFEMISYFRCLKCIQTVFSKKKDFFT